MPNTNRLLATLPGESYARLSSRFESIEMRSYDEIFHPQSPITHVYFPVSVVFSVLVLLEDGSSVEVGTIGNEGMADLTVAHGARHAESLVMTQIPGTAIRLSAAAFLEALEQDMSIRRLCGYYTQALLKQVAQSGACNRLHSAEQRTARWLLAIQDRIGQDEIPLTHELFGRMLGVRRETITTALAALQEAGAVQITRGRMRILDRAALEGATCECYVTIREAFDRILGSEPPHSA